MPIAATRLLRSCEPEHALPVQRPPDLRPLTPLPVSPGYAPVLGRSPVRPRTTNRRPRQSSTPLSCRPTPQNGLYNLVGQRVTLGCQCLLELLHLGRELRLALMYLGFGLVPGLFERR